MANVNISRVYLLDVPLENDYKNTLYFANASAQQTYFQSKIVKSYTDFSYQRKDHIIRIPEEYDEIYNVNYVMYQNTAYSNKWFYAFITDLRYVNDGMTEATIETDVIQTWLFDYNIKASFVEREHVDDDTIGKHTLPEGVETGEYINEGVVSTSPDTAHIVIAATYDCFNNEECSSYLNGVYHGVSYFLIGSNNGLSTDPSYIPSIKYFLGVYADAGKSDAITGIFIVPDELTNFSMINWDYMQTSGGLSNYKYKKLTDDIIPTHSAQDMGTTPVSKPYSTVNGYTPRNNKLFVYPYKCIMATNNAGASAIYQYEFFNNQNPVCYFETYGAITPGCSIRCYPTNYKGTADNYEEGLGFGKFPICSYDTDMYTNWLTQNGVNIAIQAVSGLGQMLVGGAMVAGSGLTAGLSGVAGGGMLVSGVTQIANLLGSVYQHQLVPPQAEGNLNCGDVNFAMGINDIMFYQKTIRSEYAQIIDKYFDMFGYKTNLVKVPNSNHRQRWWFTKTVDVNIDGNIPQNDMQKIKEAYNNGITFWRNASEIQNYSLANPIV